MKAFKFLPTRLADDSGSALIDAMAGVLVASLAVVGLASVTTTVSTAVTNTANDADRLSTLRSYVNAAALNPGGLPSGSSTATSPVTINGKPVSITTWTSETSGSVVVHGSAPKRGTADPAACADPASVEMSTCLTTSVTVNGGGGGISTEPVPVALVDTAYATAAGALAPVGAAATITSAAADTEFRFVVRVAAGETGGELVFTAGDGSVLRAVAFDAASDEYLYGSIVHPEGSAVTLSLVTATAHLSHLYVYEAPR
jgi:hypothetical protein